jgi:hypothetical protein
MSVTNQPEAGTGRSDIEALAERVRAFVRDELRQGSEPPDLTYALAFVAAELGLALASDPVQVFPAVLEAIHRATTNKIQQSNSARDSEEVPVAEVTIH